jgi:hypothetical protein
MWEIYAQNSNWKKKIEGTSLYYKTALEVFIIKINCETLIKLDGAPRPEEYRAGGINPLVQARVQIYAWPLHLDSSWTEA